MSGVVAALLTAIQRALGYGPSLYFLGLGLVVLLAMLAFRLLEARRPGAQQAPALGQAGKSPR